MYFNKCLNFRIQRLKEISLLCLKMQNHYIISGIYPLNSYIPECEQLIWLRMRFYRTLRNGSNLMFINTTLYNHYIFKWSILLTLLYVLLHYLLHYYMVGGWSSPKTIFAHFILIVANSIEEYCYYVGGMCSMGSP